MRMQQQRSFRPPAPLLTPARPLTTLRPLPAAKKMNLSVWEANKRAWHVYQKVGYIITKTRPKAYHDPEILDPAEYPNGDSDGYVMWKTL